MKELETIFESIRLEAEETRKQSNEKLGVVSMIKDIKYHLDNTVSVFEVNTQKIKYIVYSYNEYTRTMYFIGITNDYRFREYVVDTYTHNYQDVYEIWECFQNIKSEVNFDTVNKFIKEYYNGNWFVSCLDSPDNSNNPDEFVYINDITLTKDCLEVTGIQFEKRFRKSTIISLNKDPFRTYKFNNLCKGDQPQLKQLAWERINQLNRSLLF